MLKPQTRPLETRAEADLQFSPHVTDTPPLPQLLIGQDARTTRTSKQNDIKPSHSVKPNSRFLSCVQEQARLQPDAEFCVWLDNKAAISDSRTFGGLWRRAESVAHMLAREGVAEGDRVLMCFNFGLHFLDAFLGTMRLGAVAVPVYPPNPLKLTEALQKLSLVASDCKAKFGLLDKSVNALRASTTGWPEAVSWFVPRGDANSGDLPGGRTLDARSETDLAFLQYTSGSTGDPKGVMLTYGNIFSNMELNNAFEPRLLDQDAKGCSWLPQFHDMGLLAAMLYPLARGRKQVFMSPTTFLKQPVAWIEAMSKFKCTWTTAPNFAYGLSARKMSELPADRRPRLELSAMVSLCNGAEPVRLDAMREFTAAFGPFGLQATWFPSYGLAEHTVLGTTSPHRIAQDPELLSLLDKSGRFVACGDLDPDRQQVDVRIVHEGVEVEDGGVGEIWMRSGSCGQGYWGNAEKSAETFRATLRRAGGAAPGRGEGGAEEHWMRTGDEGFVERAEAGGVRRLFVCGRIKDVIIVRGRNIYPQDVEQTAERAAGGALRVNCSAAFQSPGEDGGEVEAAELLCEVKQAGHAEPALQRLCQAVVAAVRSEHSLSVRRLLLLRPRSTPKTTSGKVRRKEAARQLAAGELVRRALVVWEDLALCRHGRAPPGVGERPCSSSRAPAAAAAVAPANEGGIEEGEGQERTNSLEGVLGVVVEETAQVMGLEDGEQVDTTLPLFSLGLESISTAELAHRLSERLRVEVGPETVLAAEDLAGLARVLWEQTEGDLLAAAASLGARGSNRNLNEDTRTVSNDRSKGKHGSNAAATHEANRVQSADSEQEEASVSQRTHRATGSAALKDASEAARARRRVLRAVFHGGVQVVLVSWVLLSVYVCALPALALMERVTATDMFPFVLFRKLIEPRPFAPAVLHAWGDGNGLMLSSLGQPRPPLFSSSWVGVPVGLACAVGVFIGCLAAYVVALKWLLLGKVKEGRYPVWGWFFWRRWVVQRHAEVLLALASPLLQDASTTSGLFWLLGARIGRRSDAVLSAEVDWDMVAIGAGASVSSSATLCTAVVSEGVLHIRRVEVGAGSDVGDQAVLCPGVLLPLRTRVRPRSVVAPGALRAGHEGATIAGNPGEVVEGAPDFEGTGGASTFDSVLVPGAWLLCVALLGAVCVVPVVAVHTSLVAGVALSGLGIVAVAVGYVAMFLLALCAVTLATKWALLGRSLRAGSRIPRGSALALARECVHRLHGLVGRFVLIYAWGDESINWWYRAMGAQIGDGARISIGASLSDWDAVQLGDMVLVGGGSVLQASEVDEESGDRMVRGLQVGEGTTLGARSRIAAGSKIGKRALVTTLSHVEPGRDVEDHAVVVGAQAKRGVQSCYIPREGLPRSFPVVRDLSMWVFEAAWTVLAAWTALWVVWWLRTELRLPGMLLFPLGGGVYQLVQLLALALCQWTVSPLRRGDSEQVVHGFGGWWRLFAQLHLETAYGYSLLGQCMKGGPLATLHLACLGARVHADAYVGSTWIYDTPRLEIGEGAAINENVNISAHVVMSCACAVMPKLSLGAHSTLYPNSVCLGDVCVPAGLHLGPGSRMPSVVAGLVSDLEGEPRRMLVGVPGRHFVASGLDAEAASPDSISEGRGLPSVGSLGELSSSASPEVIHLPV